MSTGLFYCTVCIVLYLFSFGDSAAGNDDNLVFFVKRYNLGNTVGGTGMVDIAGSLKKSHNKLND